MPVAKSAFGCRIVDVEDNEYIDYCCGYGPFVQWFFGLTGKIRNPEQLVKADLNLAKRFDRLPLSKGVFFMPALRGYVSAAHTPHDIDITIASMEEAFQQL